MRTIRYHQIADELRMRVTSGEYAAGRLMPSEAELSEEFAVSRVTVRKALEVLRDEGLVNARQGFGWFVAGETVRQPLARLATIEDQMRASGMKPERRILEFAFEKAPRDDLIEKIGCLFRGRNRQDFHFVEFVRSEHSSCVTTSRTCFTSIARRVRHDLDRQL